VVEIGQDGVGRSTRIPLTLRPLARETIEAFVDRRLELAMRQENVEVDPADMATVRQQALGEMLAVAPKFVPPTKLLCDEDHRYWVQGFSVETDLQGYGPEWQVFEDGDQMAAVSFPSRVFPVHIGADGVLAVWRDDLDVERLVHMVNPLAGSY
jgi:hypothetical protein